MKKKNVMKRIGIIMSLVLISIMFMGNSGCEPTPMVDSAYNEAAKANEDAIKNVISNDTLPTIERSLERENIKRRVEFINQADRIGYLYLISDNGQLIKEVQVLGKVSSLNSYLTPMEQIEWFRSVDVGDGYGDVPIVTQAADLDGTYGENAEGIFWFTPDEVYQEWSGMYFYSSERMTFTTQPLLIEQIK